VPEFESPNARSTRPEEDAECRDRVSTALRVGRGDRSPTAAAAGSPRLPG